LWWSRMSTSLINPAAMTTNPEVKSNTQPLTDPQPMASENSLVRGFATKLYALLKSGKDCDVTFKLDDGTRIKAHRVIVSVASPVFAAMVTDPLETEGKSHLIKSVDIPDVTKEEMDMLLQVMYTDHVDLNIDVLSRMLELAVRFQLVNLLRLCTTFLQYSMNPQTIFQHLELSRVVLPDITLCMTYLNNHAQEVFNSDAFLKVSPELLSEMLKSDNLNLPEGQLFARMMEWCRHRLRSEGKDAEDRTLLRACALPFLAYIRLQSMDITDIMLYLAPSKLFDEGDILAMIMRAVLPPSSPQYPTFESAAVFKALDCTSPPRIPNVSTAWGITWDNTTLTTAKTEYEAPRVMLNARRQRAVLMTPFTDANVAEIYSKTLARFYEAIGAPAKLAQIETSRALGSLSGEYEGVLIRSAQPLARNGQLIGSSEDRLNCYLTVDSLHRSVNRSKYLRGAGGGAEYNQNSWMQIAFGLCEESVTQGNFWDAPSLVRGVQLTTAWPEPNTLVARPICPSSIQSQVNTISIPCRSFSPVNVKCVYAPGSESCVFEFREGSIQVSVPKVGTWYLFAYLYNEGDSITLC